MNWDSVLQQLFIVLQGVLPPLIVTWITDQVKKWKESLTPKQITTFVVPGLSLLISGINSLLLDANFIWSFVLGLAAIAVYEMKKNLTQE